jgi:hypothetical protein
MKSTYELKDDIIENIYDRYSDIFVIETKENANINKSMVGIIRCIVNVRSSRKYLKVGDHVIFPPSKIKHKLTTDKNGHFVVLITSYFVSKYTNDMKYPVVVHIQKYNRNTETGEISYHKDTEVIYFTYNQYVKRRMLNDFRDRPYVLVMAYENHRELQKKHNDYYRALNSTAKHFMIEHETLKSFISEVNNKKKKYKKDWIEGKLKYLEDKEIEKDLDEMFEDDTTENSATVINFEDLRL